MTSPLGRPEPGRRTPSTPAWLLALIAGVAVGLAPLPALASHVTAVHVVLEVVAVTGGAMLGLIIAGLRHDPPA